MAAGFPNANPPYELLLAMTPHAHRLTDAGRTALAAVSNLTVTVDVTFRLLILNP